MEQLTATRAGANSGSRHRGPELRLELQLSQEEPDRRCPSEKEGVRCGLPKGHYGMHQNSAFSYRLRPWSDADARRTQ